MKEVIPGIYHLQIPIPNSPVSSVNSYLVRGDRGHLLVDTGWNTEDVFNFIKSQLAEHHIDFRDISQIVVTHRHPDHYGLAGRLKQVFPAKLGFHHLENDFVNLRYRNTDKFLQQMEQWLRVNGVTAEEVPALRETALLAVNLVAASSPDVTFLGGEIITTGLFTFKVLWTPGHSSGHICLYDSFKKILISGDHILPDITPNISLYPQAASGNPLGDYLDSLNAMKQLDVSLILPGHGSPFTGLQARIEELIQHHGQRNSEILETVKAGPKTAYQISTEITWMLDVGRAGWQNLTPLDKRLALLETLAHLESMRASRKVDKFFNNSTIYYRIA